MSLGADGWGAAASCPPFITVTASVGWSRGGSQWSPRAPSLNGTSCRSYKNYSFLVRQHTKVWTNQLLLTTTKRLSVIYSDNIISTVTNRYPKPADMVLAPSETLSTQQQQGPALSGDPERWQRVTTSASVSKTDGSDARLQKNSITPAHANLICAGQHTWNRLLPDKIVICVHFKDNAAFPRFSRQISLHSC